MPCHPPSPPEDALALIPRTRELLTLPGTKGLCSCDGGTDLEMGNYPGSSQRTPSDHMTPYKEAEESARAT